MPGCGRGRFAGSMWLEEGGGGGGWCVFYRDREVDGGGGVA